MFDKEPLDRNDALGKELQDVGSQMTPPPALEKAVISGIPFAPRVHASTHVKRFTKAVLVYAVCIALLLGSVHFIASLLGGSDPVPGNPTTDVTDHSREPHHNTSDSLPNTESTAAPQPETEPAPAITDEPPATAEPETKPVTEACTHEEVIDAAVTATCTATGLTEGKHCRLCGEILVKQETVSRLDHVYETSVVAPTCSKDGYTLHKCACGASKKTDPTNKTHRHDVQRVEAEDVDSDGNPIIEMQNRCTVCNQKFIDYGNADRRGGVISPVRYYISGNYDKPGDWVLVISGSGAMPDYSDNSLPPWDFYLFGIRKIIIADGITTIGAYSFTASDNAVTELEMGKDVKVLKQSCVKGLKLETIRLGENVQRLESSGFSYSKTQNVYWPVTLTYIGDSALPAYATIHYQGTQEQFKRITCYSWPSDITMEERLSYSPELWNNIRYNAW
ncbi:MAG: leucine-rich repeat protein [Clostridia bacterium]|nr:leucine-rich repeat protein [Clostridia bacterium]